MDTVGETNVTHILKVKRIFLALVFSAWAVPLLAQSNLLPTLQAFRGQYPTPMSPAQLAEYINKVAWQHRAEGWGLLRKDSGSRCPLPNGVPISCDFLFHLPSRTGFDVLIASDTDAIPAWQGPFDLSAGTSRYVAPLAPTEPPVSTSGDVPVPGDYDGDGQIDVAVYRSTTGQWLIAQSRDGSQIIPWGAPVDALLGDTPVPADYDGDRRTDVAVFRSATGQWFIRNSSNLSLSVINHGAGSASGLGDVPMAGDYDRDGKADLGIYRRATGEWFILRSSDGGQTHVQWGAP
jgi:VCBS repeat protein